jgi:hypothetical protein
MTEALRNEVCDASLGSQLWVDRSRSGVLLFTTQGEIAFRQPSVELMNVSHPLVKAAVRAVAGQLDDPISRVGQTVVTLSADEDREFPAGVYFLLVFTHTVEGIRGRRILESVAWCEPEQRLLDAESAERLLHLATERGQEWDRTELGSPMSRDVWSQAVSEVRRRNRELLEREQRENEGLYARRKRVLEAEYQHDRQVKETRLHTAQARGHERVLPALRGQLDKAEAEYRAKLASLEETRTASARLSEPLAVCLMEVRRP